ncbi:SusC/RagA family TonB-linked outer membrane protein [Pedobacter metabolipauper]|uniref:TonB-linked SusC/RagA family outer membrane protein n=1 Tax=Pedobacter metabolipauper TaxID=425513 RepID=A0A4R6SQM9_9SPHI|nr:TonB-dependent receptor [Pedobacter metabolipauper]TDQ06346.1 TonB-linked SusC/RagA family outer membrane protein [Pedobacter metabolipauper]
MSTTLRAIWLFMLCLGSINIALAQNTQNRVITGTVFDESKTSLPGVGVVIKGGTTSALTNIDGKFTITVPSNTTTLVFSYIGMKTQEVLVGTRSTLNITLESATTTLTDVVVIGYGTAKRSDVTSAISSIGEKDIKNLPVSGIDQALQGKLAGVSVNNNGGQPGGGVSVRVRGVTSVNGNEPLYVVDGVPLQTTRSTISQDQLGGMGGQTSQSPLASLNPSDILSIDILKDASAQAIYGSQAANGVVIVTTKRGKAGEGRITYEGYYGLQEVQKKLDIMDLSQFAQYNNEVLGEIAAVDGNPTYTTIGEFQNPSILGKGTDWQDEVFRRGKMQNHQVSFSGGQDKTTYYTSLNYFDQEGTILGSEFKRVSLRFNIDQQVKSWLKIGLSANGTRSNQRISLTNGSDAIVTIATANSPAAPVFTPSGGYATTVAVGGYNFGNVRNPIALALAREVRNIQTKGYGNLFGELSFTKFLTFRSEVNFDYTVGDNSAFQPYIDGILTPSKLVEQRSTNVYYGLRNFFNYNQTFGRHNVTALLGHEIQEGEYDQLDASRQNLTQNIPAIGAGGEAGQTLGSYLGNFAMESYFARAGYSYDNRYALNLSIRRDGSSAFGPDNRIGYFPAASIGWTVTNEAFAKDIKFLNYLKVRAGAGAVGNQNSPTANAYVTRVRLVSTAPFGQGGIPQNVGNPKLGWESVITYNGGIDMAFLNKRLEVSVDVYKKETSDMILSSSLPVFTGIGTQYNDIQAPVVNAGNMVNKGFDIAVTTYNMNRQDFEWRTNVVFSRYKNILNALNSETSDISRYVEYGNAVLLTRTVPGRSVGGFYGFLEDGLFRSMEQLNSSADQGLGINPKGTWLGDIKYKDLNSDGVIDDKDLTFIGDPNPDFTFGITNTFRYKSFDLSVFLQGTYGNDVLNYTKRTTEALNNVYSNQLVTVTDRYSASNPNGTIPRYNQWHNNNIRVSDRFVEDGSYLRIQNVTIGYNLPAKLIAKAKMSNARVFASGQNLHTFTKYTGYDPELGAFNGGATFFNIDNGNYPNPRTFTFGVNVTF